MGWRIGIDSGGTFTDICLFDESSGRIAVWKVSSTPADPSQAVAEGLGEALTRIAADAGDVSFFGHGTTVATNALIQHRGAPTGLITSDGFRDLLEIGRQKRPDLYDLQADKLAVAQEPLPAAVTTGRHPKPFTAPAARSGPAATAGPAPRQTCADRPQID